MIRCDHPRHAKILPLRESLRGRVMVARVRPDSGFYRESVGGLHFAVNVTIE